MLTRLVSKHHLVVQTHKQKRQSSEITVRPSNFHFPFRKRFTTPAGAAEYV